MPPRLDDEPAHQAVVLPVVQCDEWEGVMTEAEKPPLEEAIEWLEQGVRDGFLPDEMSLPQVMEAARRYASIEKAVKAGTLKLVTVEQPKNALGQSIPGLHTAVSHAAAKDLEGFFKAVKSYGTDPLIKGGGW